MSAPLKGLVALLIAVALGVNATTARADDVSLKTTLQARYAAMKIAMGNRDDNAVAALLAPDFESVDTSGQSENTAQMMQELHSLKQDPQKVSVTTILSVEPNGNTATVDQRYDMKTVKTAPDGGKHNVELITLSTDTWVDAGGQWLMQKTVTNQLDYYQDGKQVAHKVRQP